MLTDLQTELDQKDDLLRKFEGQKAGDKTEGLPADSSQATHSKESSSGKSSRAVSRDGEPGANANERHETTTRRISSQKSRYK